MKTLKTSVMRSSKFRLTALTTAFLVAGGILLAPSPSWAQDLQEDAAFTCASAVNVMDCIKQTGTGAPKAADATAIPINSQALGFTGPITAGIRYDNYLAWILDVGYAQEFYNSAAAFKLSAGLNERRANVTLGYSITPKQQIKLTYEYLAQNLPFDYASGQINEWVSQNALGGAYRYILDNGIVRALEVYGTYTKASSKELSEVEMYTDNVLTAINYRRIAGGAETTAGTSVTLTPFKNTLVKLGAGYSTLSFDTQWSDPSTSSVIAYNAELSHLLTPTTLISTGIGNTASGRTHTARVSQILPWNLEASLIGQYTATTNDIPSSTSVTANLSYPAPKTYTNMFSEGIGKLKDWVEKPVIYNTRVLAKAEERVVAVQITTNPIPNTTVAVGNFLDPEIQTKDYFLYNQGVFDKIEYKILSVNTTNNQPATATLNLQVKPVDSFNAVVSSSGPMPESAMTPGGYIVTLNAQGYRNGQVVSHVNNPIDLTVSANPNLSAPEWNSKTLPEATPGQAYPTVPLSPYVTSTSGLSGETYNFTIKQGPSWLTLGTSNNEPALIPKGTVTGGTQSVDIILAATSMASGKAATPDPKTFTISLGGVFVLPDWQSAVTALPSAVAGTPSYQDANGGAIDLSPYESATYLTKTKQAGLDINDQLTFTVDTIPSDACKWLEITDATKGTLGGKPIGNTCNAYIKVHSMVANESKLLTKQISLSQITGPTWVSPSDTLPPATVGVEYKDNDNFVTLSPYETTKYLTKTKQGTTEINDTLSFELDPATTCSGMVIKPEDAAKGTLTWANPTGASCKVFVRINSAAVTAAGGEVLLLSAKTINVTTPSSPPTWTGNPKVITLAYYSLTSPYPIVLVDTNNPSYNGNYGANPEYVTTQSTLSIPTSNNPKTIQNLPSGPFLSGILTDNNVTSVTIAAPQSLSDVGATGIFRIEATNASGTSGGDFNVQIVPNPALTGPTTVPGADLPVASAGDDYPSTNLNPSNNITYFTKTALASGAAVEDEYNFSSQDKGHTDACQWLAISPLGVLSGKPGVEGDDCYAYFTITSKATGLTYPSATSNDRFKMFIKFKGAPPQWNSDLNEDIKFDDATTGINLNSLIQTEAQIPSLRMYFVDSGTAFSKDGQWEIKKDTSSSVPKFTLVRRSTLQDGQPAFNAGDINSAHAVEVAIKATNNKVNANDENNPIYNGALKISVLPDNVQYVWAGGIISAKVGDPAISKLLDSSVIKTCLDASCNTLVINDSFTGFATNVLTLTTPGQAVTISSSAGGYLLNIPTNTMMNADLGITSGTYTLPITGITSKAGGTVVGTTTGDLKVIANPTLNFGTANPFTMKFSTYHQSFPDSINLSSYLTYGNGPGIAIILSPKLANWRITSTINANTSTYFLVRDTVNGQIDSSDIGKTIDLAVLVAGSTTAVPLKVTVASDSSVQFKWTGGPLQVNQGKSASYAVYNNSVPSSSDRLKVCVDNCSIEVINDYITMGGVVMTFPGSTSSVTVGLSGSTYMLAIPSTNITGVYNNKPLPALSSKARDGNSTAKDTTMFPSFPLNIEICNPTLGCTQ